MPDRLEKEEIDRRIGALINWQLDDQSTAIVKEFDFSDFEKAFAFMKFIAPVFSQYDHHPDWSNSYNRLTIRLATHSAKGLTKLDFEVAHCVDDKFTEFSNL